MKKIFNLMMALAVAILATGFASCSKDDDGPDGGAGNGKGSMTGWIEVEGSRYNLNYCWDFPDENPNDNSWAILAASRDIDKKGKPISDDFNMAVLTITQNSEGTWWYDIEFQTKFNYFDGSRIVGYTFRGSDATIEKNGDNFLIEAEDINMYRYESDYSQPTTVTGSFHFSGKPATLKNTVVG